MLYILQNLEHELTEKKEQKNCNTTLALKERKKERMFIYPLRAK